MSNTVATPADQLRAAAARTPARRMELFYGLPEGTLKRGGRVLFEGKPGVITGFAAGGGMNVRIRLDGETSSAPYHPTWNITYLPPGGAA